MSLMNSLGSGKRFVFGEYGYADGARFGPLLGPQLEIIFLRTGQVRILMDDRSLEITAPCFAFLTSRRRLEYRYASQEMCHVAWCQCVSPDLKEDAIDVARSYVGSLPPSDISVTLMKIGTELPIHTDDESPEFVSALAVALFEEFFNRKRKDTSKPARPHQVELVHWHIEQNFERAISMAELAQVSGLSPQHLNRLYYEAYGENPLDYLWRIRTRQGAFLLQHTGLRISQIAYKTGFKTPNHFSRRIKERFGLSPRALRARRWQGTASITSEA